MHNYLEAFKSEALAVEIKDLYVQDNFYHDNS